MPIQLRALLIQPIAGFLKTGKPPYLAHLMLGAPAHKRPASFLGRSGALQPAAALLGAKEASDHLDTGVRKQLR